MGLRIVLCAIVTLAISIASNAESLREKQTLKGAESIIVNVLLSGEQLENGGVRQDQIKTDVELRLRKHGIRVISEVNGQNLLNSPQLSVSVTVIKEKWFRISPLFDIVYLWQHVSLLREPKIVSPAVTWERGAFGGTGLKALHQIRDQITDIVDQFVNDYLSVNQ